MLPEITKELLIQYLILFLILAPLTIFVVIYHLSLPKVIEEEPEVIQEKLEKPSSLKVPEKKKKVDINKLYADLKKKYDPAKAGDKKTRLRNKQIIQQIEKAYRLKDIKTLHSF